MKICIDAGHAGKTNPYVVNGKTIGWESEMAWKLHLLLRDKLQAAGVEVICTRTEQRKDMDLVPRGRKAEGCDLFLSLHSNAGSSAADYPVACCSVDGTADEIGMKLARAVDEVMQTAQTARIWKRDYEKGMGEMIQLVGDPNFGKRTAPQDYYGVLRGAAQVGVPGVLLECSFHSNPVMAKWLVDNDNLGKLADALCMVLTEHFSVEELSWKKKYTDLSARYDALIGALNELMDRYKGGITNGQS